MFLWVTISTKRDTLFDFLQQLVLWSKHCKVWHIVFFVVVRVMKLNASRMILSTFLTRVLLLKFFPPLLKVWSPSGGFIHILLFVLEIMLPTILFLTFNTLALKPSGLMWFEFLNWQWFFAHTTCFFHVVYRVIPSKLSKIWKEFLRAGGRNRTDITTLEGSGTANIPHPRSSFSTLHFL